MIYRQKSGRSWDASNDDPGMDFGISLLDDKSVQKTLAAVAPALKRDFVLMALKSNLLAAERKAALAKFPSTDFKKVAVVVMGEPPAEVKAKAHEKILAEKQEAAKQEKERKDQEKKKEKERKE